MRETSEGVSVRTAFEPKAFFAHLGGFEPPTRGLEV
jgi:hypothetical protein